MTAWKQSHPDDTFAYRDLGHHPVPHVDEPWIAAAFTPPPNRTEELDRAIALSDALVDEFLAADRYVFGVPMYNFSIPSTFKAYIDQIVRVGRTFAVNEQGFQGLVDSSKKMLVITARGGSYQQGTPAASYDLQEPYIRSIFGFVGITDITFIHVDNLNSDVDKSLGNAQGVIEQVLASW
jgi:FMN-dependent NADH-azoreductase